MPVRTLVLAWREFSVLGGTTPMLQFGPYPPRRRWDGHPPVASIDSNVMNEFLTTVDLGRAVDLRAFTGSRKDLEYRRLRARGTLWMAMALDSQAASTLTLEDECLPFVFNTPASRRAKRG